MENNQVKPNNHLALAIITTCLCCVPLGIVSIVKSTKVNGLYESGQYAEAQRAADDAKKYAYWGIGISAVVYILYIVLMIVGVVAGS